MGLDLLGFARFDQHRTWRCRGRVSPSPDLDPEDAADLLPSDFTLERRHDRWALFTRRMLLAVGDDRRDLVSRLGGLARMPASQGFAQFEGASLLRQVGSFDRAVVSGLAVVRSVPARRAGRDAVDVRLEHEAGVQLVLGVDTETGIWTGVETPGYTIEVDDLSTTEERVPALDLLDLVPDVDLVSGAEPAIESLRPIVHAVQEASGLRVEVLQQDEESETFRLVLLAGDRPVGLVSRQHVELVQEEPVFGGRQGWISGDEWATHVDSSQEDPRWVDSLLRLIQAP